jgi:hypothetical protein
MSVDIIRSVRSVLSRSEFLSLVHLGRQEGGRRLVLGDGELRRLSDEEVDRLERQGNTADAWDHLRVAEGFDSRHVRHCHFQGAVVIGRLRGHVREVDGVALPSGLAHATIANCVLGHEVVVRNVQLLGNCVVGAGVVLLDCGSITCDPETKFGNGFLLRVGPETGGREVPAFAEIDVETAAAVAERPFGPEVLREYAEAVAEYAARAQLGRGFIGRGAVVCHTPRVRNCFVGPFARIDGATLVSDCTLLSTEEEPSRIESGACVRESILQWSCRVDTLAVVERSVLTEHSSVERHAKVMDSLLGPNTNVAEGEVKCSLVGPFVGFHHQALLIAALWPEGKGNVSHGANAGSNHTTRAPDQEFWPGEGLFLGLGVNLLFPLNFRRAPYSVLAAGLRVSPQKVEYPFSLLRAPSAASPAIPVNCNEILPAWMLSENLYAIRRAETKFRARNQARRTEFTYAVFRPEIVDLMRDACQRLEQVREVREVYTAADIPGLGKNYLVEARRQAAIAAYQFHIRLYALLGLKNAVQAALRIGRADRVDRLLAALDDGAGCVHQRRILRDDLGLVDVLAALRLLPSCLNRAALAMLRSRAKDDERGPRIIDDYAAAHGTAAQDPVVQQVYAETCELQEEVRQLIVALEATTPARGPTASAAR